MKSNDSEPSDFLFLSITIVLIIYAQIATVGALVFGWHPIPQLLLEPTTKGLAWLALALVISIFVGAFLIILLKFHASHGQDSWGVIGFLLTFVPGYLVFLFSLIFVCLQSVGAFIGVRCGNLSDWLQIIRIVWNSFLKGFLGDFMESYHLDIVRCSSTNFALDTFDFSVRTIAAFAFLADALLFGRLTWNKLRLPDTNG